MRSSFTWLFAAATLLTPSLAFSDNIGSQSLVRRADFTPVTGAQGDVKPRLEVRQLKETQPDQWTLFVLAMDRFQQQQMDDATGSGYYGIAGIHGVPPVSWGGVEQCSNCTNGPPGYCTHVSPHFPAWHRVYMALFEQLLIENAKSIAGMFTGDKQAAMQQAAEDLRCPFWDWAANPKQGQPAVPDFMTQPSLTVDGPAGSQQIANPLYQHSFKNPSALVYDPYVEWQETIRYPTNNNADATSNDQGFVDVINARYGQLQTEVYTMFQNCKDYTAFSNTGSATQQCATSLEAIHNDVHSICGGVPDPSGKGPQQGHMTYLPLAAFDPIFWVHHANVDRIFAMWQTINPDQYSYSEPAKLGTWTIEMGSIQSQDSPLTPFKKSSGDFWTTTDVRDWATTFKYTYPEFINSDGSSNAIQNYINALYGPSPVLTAGSVPASKPSSSNTTSPSASPSSGSKLPFGNSTGSTGDETQSGSKSGSGSGSGSGSSSGSNPLGGILPSIGGLVGGLTGGLLGGNKGSNSQVPGLPDLTNIPGLITGAISGLENLLKPGATMEQYIANIQTPRGVFNGSYAVYLFDGAPGAASSAWYTAQNLIGTVNVLAGGMNMPGDVLAFGSITMTKYVSKLVDAGTIPSMDSSDVLPYLNKNLEWRIVSPQGVVSPSKVKGFDLSVLSSTSEAPGQGLLPIWKPVTPQLQVTKGKEGGASELPKIVGGFIEGLLGGNKDSSASYSNSAPSYGEGDVSTVADSEPSATAPSYGTSYGNEGSAPAPTAAAPSPKEDDTVYSTVTVTTTYCPCSTGSAHTY